MIIITMAVAKAKKVKVFPFDLIASWLVFALPLAALIFFLPLGLPLEFSKQVIVAVLVCVSLALFLLSRLQDNSITLPGYPVLAGLFLVLITAALSALLSPAKMPALFGLGGETTTVIGLELGFLVMFLSSVYLKERSRIGWFILALLIGFLVFIVLEIVRLVSGWSLNVLGLAYDLPVFAGFIAVMSLAALELWPLASSHWRWLVRGALAVSLGYLALANLAPLWFLVALASLLLLIHQLLLAYGPPEGRFSRASVLRPSFFVLILSLFFLPLLSARTNLLGSSLNRLGTAIGWSRPLEVVYPLSDLPTVFPKSIIGTSPNTFSTNWLRQSSTALNRADDGAIKFPWGIGAWMRAALETGWLGLLSWLAFLGAMLFYSAKFLNELFAGKKAPGFLLIFLGAAYLWCLNIFYAPGLALTVLSFAFTGIVLAEASGLGLIPVWRHEAKQSRTIFVIIMVLLLVASVLGIYFFLQRFAARYHFTQAVRVAQEPGQAMAVYDELTRALKLEENDLYLRGVAEWGGVRLNELLVAQGIAPESLQQDASRAIDAAVAAGQRAVSYRPSAENWFTLGALYERLVPLGVTGAAGEAAKAYGSASQLSPFDFTIWFRLGALTYSVGDYESALTALERAVNLNPLYANARYFLGLTYDKLGRREAALDQFLRIRETNPDNAEVNQIIQQLTTRDPAPSGN